jgi:2-amino-4-hydroxy-6-hydroxymethyldihydropteridine diphosphokinase
MLSRPPVFLGLGSNVGDREGNLDRGLRLLESRAFTITASSSVYETEPVGGPPQGPYLNMVVRGETALGPEALLEACLATERDMGRVRAERFGPRTLDVDILLYGDLVLDTPDLTLPHPQLHERRFVLVPLAEIAPDEARHPLLGLTAAEMLDRCPDASGVARHAAQGMRA